MAFKFHTPGTTPFVLAIIAVVAIVSIISHQYAGYSMPPPWPDEAHFLWQATAVAEHGTLFSAELNPDRAIMWQPPGYFVIVGAAFKLFGANLAVARGVSLAFVLVAFAVLCLIMQALKLPWPVYILAALFWTNSQFVACGNIARMEAPLMAVGLSGFYLVLIKRQLPGLAILLITPLIHPNGAYFVLAGLCALVLPTDLPSQSSWRRDAAGWVLIATALAMWLWYALYLTGNWVGFNQDMAFQLARKAARSRMQYVTSKETIRFFIFLVPAAIWVWYCRRGLIATVPIALMLWLVWVMGDEMWYRIYYVLALLIVLVLLTTASIDIATRWKFLQSKLHQRLWAVGVATLILATNLNAHNIEPMWRYPACMSFYDMTPQAAMPYNDPDDTRQVTEHLRAMLAGHSASVEFYPWADAFMFMPLRDSQTILTRPLFCDIPPRLLVYHHSPLYSAGFRKLWSEDLAGRNLGPIEVDSFLIHSNAAGEKWYARIIKTEEN